MSRHIDRSLSAHEKKGTQERQEAFEASETLHLRVIDRMRTYIHTFGLPGLPLLLSLLPLPLPLSHSLSPIVKTLYPYPSILLGT